MEIRGLRVLVTGASSGIGKDLARGFAAVGADVAVVARGTDRLERVADEVGGRAYPTDLTDRESLRDLVGRVEADGPVDILINNAADECVGRFTDMDADTLEYMVRLNVLAGAELSRQAVPRMLVRRRGHIVNISSIGGVVLPPMLATYAATKAFATHHAANLRFELAGTPIGVTRVEIGEVADTGLMDKGRTSPEVTQLVERMYRLRASRVIRCEEITDATIDAVRRNRATVRLPRRNAVACAVASLPRGVGALVGRGIIAPATPRSTDPLTERPRVTPPLSGTPGGGQG